MSRQLFNAMAAQYATLEVSGNGLVNWDAGVKCVVPSVKLYGAVVQNGMPTPDVPVMPACNNGLFRSTNAGGVWNGGQVQAPELWAIPGTDYRDEWDPQTGKGIRRIKKRALDGTEAWTFVSENNGFVRFWTTDQYTVGNINRTAVISNCLKTAIIEGTNRCWLTGDPVGLLNIDIDKNIIGGNTVDVFQAYLATRYAVDNPITVWFALATPEPFYSPPARLTQPRGFGQIIQAGGDIADCPIATKYLTHRRNTYAIRYTN